MSALTDTHPRLETLPVVDLSLLDQGASARQEFLTTLRKATHEVGFFYLVGHGIPAELLEEIFAEARRFFALPIEDKMEIEMKNSPHFRGYTRVGGEYTRGEIDWREQIDFGTERPVVTDPQAPAYMRLDGPNQWPSALPSLREVCTRWDEHCMRIARRLMRAWAESLGSPADIFDDAIGERPSTLTKLVRYPGRKERGQGVGAHKDPGMLTLLMVEPSKEGLQVEHQGEWIDAPPVPGAFVVNIGELLEHATDGYLKATMHRVVAPAAQEERLSVPFFFNPALDAHIPKLELPEDLAAHAPGVTQDPDDLIYGTMGENMLKARLRAHPDVAQKHHADLL